MRVSSFKAQYRRAPARSATPPPPVYEPISPILAPYDLAAAAPASAKNDTTLEDHNDLTQSIQPTSGHGHGHRGQDSPRLSPPPAASGPSRQPAPLQSTNLHYSPALRSPIDALANAAVSSFDTNSIYTGPSRRLSRGSLFSPSTVTARPRASEHAAQHGYAEPASAHSERPSKRARFEHFQQNTRPATSYNSGWSYNVEQMVDNSVGAYQTDPTPAFYQPDNQMKRLSDAQLLLDFAISAPYAVKNADSPTAKRWSVSHMQTTSDHHTVPAPNGLHTAVRYPDARIADSSLPSALSQNVQSANSAHVPSAVQTITRPPIQIHTPPEEVLGAPISANAGVSNDVEEKKSKRGQGWPKGKPRGPRNGTTADKKKKPVLKQGSIPTNVPSELTAAVTAVDQLQSPQSLSADGLEVPHQDASGLAVPVPLEPTPGALQRRRLSYSVVPESETKASAAHSTSPRARSVPPLTTMAITPFSDDADHMEIENTQEIPQVTICAGCHSTDSLTSIGDGEQWISCDGCKEWFHYSCAGFKSEREVRAIDKFYCNGCKPKFGNTTSKSTSWSLLLFPVILIL